MASKWRIYYSDGSHVDGVTKADWRAAPSSGVQVVVLFEAPEHPHWTYKKDGQNIVVTDRKLLTGVDQFNLRGWGAKDGELLSDDAYFQIWEAACGDT